VRKTGTGRQGEERRLGSLREEAIGDRVKDKERQMAGSGSGGFSIPTPKMSGFAYSGPDHQVFLDMAKLLLDQGQQQMTVIAAQMACEVCVEQALGKLLKHKGLDFLEESIDSLIPSYNLANDKVRKLYVAVSADKVQDAPFWSKFKEFVQLRNKIVHEGKWIERCEAEESLEVASKLVQLI